MCRISRRHWGWQFQGCLESFVVFVQNLMWSFGVVGAPHLFGDRHSYVWAFGVVGSTVFFIGRFWSASFLDMKVF